MYFKALAGAVLAGAAIIAGAVFFPGAQPDPAPGVNVTPAGFCVFGTHGGKGHGCRGGSLIDVPAAKKALSDTGHMYKDAGECAGTGIITAGAEPGLTPTQFAGKSFVNATVCGAAKRGDLGLGSDDD